MQRRSTVWGAFIIVCTLLVSLTSIALAAPAQQAAPQGVVGLQQPVPPPGPIAEAPDDRSAGGFDLTDESEVGDIDQGGLLEIDPTEDETLSDGAPSVPEGDAVIADSDEFVGTDGRGLDGMRTEVANLNVSVGLSLVGAKIVKFDPDDTDDEFVEFLFGEKVLEIYDPRSFKLIGVSSNEVVSARQVFRDEKNPFALIVGFEPGIDPTNFALAAVEPGAVASIKGEINPGDSDVLIGSLVKDKFSSAVPKLVGARIEPSLERIIYFFDEKLDESGADPALFGFYTFEGQLHYPSAITSVNDKEVIAKFNENAGDQVEEAARAVVFAGAVRDKSGLPNPLGSFGGVTTAPDVVKVLIGPTRTQFDFVFDQDVTSPKPLLFSVFTRLGKPYLAKDARLIAPNVVRVIVPEVREFTDEAVFGSVEPGAVIGDFGFGTESTGGGLIVSNKKLDDIGLISGPELVNVQVNAKESMVKFFFDEKVDDDQIADPSLFSLISVSGSVQPATAFVDADDKWVVVTFPPAAIKAAQTAMISAGAVRDFEGNTNPPSVYK